MDKLKNEFLNLYRKGYEKIISPPSTSSFEKTGTITPTEFIIAGD